MAEKSHFISRRDLLRGVGIAGAAAATGPVSLLSTPDTASAAEPAQAAARPAAPREAFENLTATEADLLAFFSAMDAHRGQPLLVHCGANYRVSAFLGLYNALKLGQSSDEAFALMDSVWRPDAVWTQFIQDMLSRHGG